MSKVLRIFVIVIIMVGLGGVLYFSAQNTCAPAVNQTETTTESERRIYQNDMHKFSKRFL